MDDYNLIKHFSINIKIILHMIIIISELPSGTDLCLTMWLDFDRPEGSWNEWDCNYASGYSALCKRSLKRTSITTTGIDLFFVVFFFFVFFCFL